MKVPGAGGRVEYLDVVVGEAAAEVLLGAGGPRPCIMKSTTSLGVYTTPSLSAAAGIVRFIKILVDGLQEALLLGVVGDLVGGPARWPRSMRAAGLSPAVARRR